MMKYSDVDWWDIVSRICMEIGGILLLNGLLMKLFMKSKLIGKLSFMVSKTKVIIPALLLVLSSFSVSVIVKLASFLINQNK